MKQQPLSENDLGTDPSLMSPRRGFKFSFSRINGNRGAEMRTAQCRTLPANTFRQSRENLIIGGASAAVAAAAVAAVAASAAPTDAAFAVASVAAAFPAAAVVSIRVRLAALR